jgi:hypothetical protein
MRSQAFNSVLRQAKGSFNFAIPVPKATPMSYGVSLLDINVGADLRVAYDIKLTDYSVDRMTLTFQLSTCISS